MIQKVILCLGVIIGMSAAAQKINVRGKVTDSDGNPIKAAVVSLEQQNLADTTKDDGVYAITKNIVAALPYVIPAAGGVTFRNGVLEFRLTGSSPVNAEVYDVKGTLLKREAIPDAQPGIYRLEILRNIKSTQMLVIHASVGSAVTTFRYLAMKNGGGTMARAFGHRFSSGGTLARVVADKDYLKVKADGYSPDSVEISSYDTTIDFTLESAGAGLCEGCGKTDYPKSGKKTIEAAGMEREYILKLPDNYDPGKKYKLIFCIHAWGGNMDQIAQQGYYGLEKLSNGTTIFVSPQGLEDDGNPRGWFNPDGRDIKFIKAMLDYFNANLCIDQERIFSTGFSFGGMMSFAIGCSFHNVFRAIAPMSGAFYSGCDESDQGPIAVWMAHGKSDKTVPLDHGKEARDYFLERNGCSNETVPVEPSPCVAYQGCNGDAPFIYCEFEGGHAPQKWAQQATWDFFNQF